MSEIRTDIDFNTEGEQVGYFYVPCPRNDSAWGVIPTLIGRYKRGEGKTILLTAGAHGDEFEGPIALRKLMERLKTIDYKGEILIVPVMNIPAMNDSQRLSPLDGRDLNRSFYKGIESVTGRISSFVMDELISRADIVLDFHSGGNSLDFLPAIIMHDLSNKDIKSKTLDALKAFNAPYGLILDEIDTKGMLDSHVEELGKIFLTTELRGGGKVNPDGVKVAENGLAKLLEHFGFVKSTKDFQDVIIDYSTVYFDVPSEDFFVRPFSRKVFEPLKELGETVSKGEVIGLVHNIESSNLSTIKLKAKVSGTILANRPRALCNPGDTVFMLGEKKN